MKHERTSLKITSLAALIVFAVFTLCALLVLLTGAKVYRQVTARTQARYDAATAAQYLTTRVHQADRAEALTLEAFGDAEALVLKSEIEGARYETRIYCSGGWLCELFSPQGAGLAPEDGERILPVHALSFTLQGRLLTARFTDESGTEQVLNLALRARQEAAP